MPSPTRPARSGAVQWVQPPEDGFFEPVDFIGGMGGTDWTQGWTDYTQN
jgi:hypothetical protein